MKRIKTHNLNKEYINNCKLVRFMTNLDLNDAYENGIELQLKTYKKRKRDIYITAGIMSSVQIDGQITPYDLAVMDSIYTLFVDGLKVLPIEKIIRTLSGNMYQDITYSKRRSVIKSIEKMIRLRITIDCTDEMIAREEEWSSDLMREQYLLPLNTIKAKDSNEILAYEIEQEPALYKYAGKIGQIIDVRLDIMELRGSLSDTDEVVVIKRYLIMRIERMKNKRNKIISRKISYQWWDKNKKEFKGLLADLGYNPAAFSNWRKKKARIHHIISELLTEYVSVGYIKDFTIIKKGNSIDGYCIEI